jgi:mRNA interferase RelE/StbE
MEEIIENSAHYKPLGNILKGRRRVHIGSFVVVYSVDEKEKLIKFLEFDHHDKVY